MRKLTFFMSTISAILICCEKPASSSIFGEETAVLLEVVSNQLTELTKLAENIGISKSQFELLTQVNDGINQSTQQLNSISAIVERAQGVEPESVSDLSRINQRIDDLKSISGDVQELLSLKMSLCDQAVDEAAIQSDTSYKMGQEMVDLGSQLSAESKIASPGRAQQISASASSAQMLAMGVQLQTLSQISQLLALQLDIQKGHIARELRIDTVRRAYFKQVFAKVRTALQSTIGTQPAKKHGRKSK